MFSFWRRRFFVRSILVGAAVSITFFVLPWHAALTAHAEQGSATPATPAAAAINLNPANSNPAQYIINIYDFALIAAGAIAFLMVLYAGIQYLTSAGNPSKAQEATGKLTDTALGIVLLFGAFILLRTINPNLVNLTLPGLAGVNTGTPTTSTPSNTPDCSGASACHGGGQPGCPSGYSCNFQTSLNACECQETSTTPPPLNCNAPNACSTSQGPGCPSGYTCQQSGSQCLCT